MKLAIILLACSVLAGVCYAATLTTTGGSDTLTTTGGSQNLSFSAVQPTYYMLMESGSKVLMETSGAIQMEQ